MRTFQYTFAPGETKVFPGGRFLILITAANPVDVDYFVGGSNNNENATGVLAGYFYDVEDGKEFTSVRINSAAAQTVTLAISRGSGGYNIASTIITGGGFTDPVQINNNLNTDNGTHGFYFGRTQPSTAAYYSGAWLRNLGSGGERVYLKKMSFNIDDPNAVGGQDILVRLGKNYTNNGSGSTTYPKDIGDADISTGIVRAEMYSSLATALASTFQGLRQFNVGQEYTIDFNDAPIRIDNGENFGLHLDPLGYRLSMQFDFELVS